MTGSKKQVCITGIGLVTCFGEGTSLHWSTLGGNKAPQPVINPEIVPPFGVHPLPEIDWSQQIPRRGDQRQMENWQRLGTYAAGLALDDAGLKEDLDLCSTMDLVVAAGGGERDIETDEAIMRDALASNDREKVILDRLPSDLRPTLFLAQLSNLLAGNISIVHKVTGSSRTYMGEENAGVNVIENAAARIASGNSTHILVGGSYSADRPDAILPHVLGHLLYDQGQHGVHERQAHGGGMRMGSIGTFLVLEEAEHAKKRGAKAYAQLSSVRSSLVNRSKDGAVAKLGDLYDEMNKPTPDAILSGTGGVADAYKFEFEFLRNKFGDKLPIRAFQTMVGQSLEANLPTGVALAAIALANGGFYPPFEDAETQTAEDIARILVTSFAYEFGEGFAMVEKL